MPSNFVILTKDKFESYLPDDFSIVENTRAKEIIYSLPTEKENLSVRIYSSVDVRTETTRECGTDAIRIVFWDDLNNRPIGKTSRINRVEGRTTVGQRIKNKIDYFLSNIDDAKIVDFDYVRKVLEANTWSSFAENLLDKLDQYGKLTSGQLAYVLGDTNPKGKNTFEAIAKKKNPNFADNENKGIEDDDFQKESERSADDRQCNVGSMFEEKERSEKRQSTDETEKRTSQAYKNQIIVSDGTDIELIPTSNHSYYQYPFDTFNPVQSIVFPHKKEDKNILLGANTSAGKTIAAEIVMDEILQQGNKIIYLSPLKSLTQEKYDDWSKRYSNKTITIMTGDYTISESKKKKLKNSDIIVMTSEMMDSRTRKMLYEKNYWLREVGLVIVDESHILTTDRGHAVEAGVMRFTRINHNARIMFLSATMPNVEELGDWLTVLNGKETIIINCNWRPVELQMTYLEHPVYRAYHRTQDVKRKMVVDCVMQKQDESHLVFVHDKTTGRDLVRRFNAIGEDAIFHSADGSMEERKAIENAFRSRKQRVLISTSTLAWGAVHKNTLIEMANGKNKLARQIKKGDNILSYNKKTKYFEQDIVQNVQQYKSEWEIEIEMENGIVITVDHRHPIYIRKADGSIITKEARYLNLDDDIITGDELRETQYEEICNM